MGELSEEEEDGADSDAGSGDEDDLDERGESGNGVGKLVVSYEQRDYRRRQTYHVLQTSITAPITHIHNLATCV